MRISWGFAGHAISMALSSGRNLYWRAETLQFVNAMTLRSLLWLSLMAVVALPLKPAARLAEATNVQPSFTSEVDLVSLNVTVTDSANRYITDLSDQDFEVYEDGIKQDLTLFNKSNLPVALSLLIDTSSSMEERITTAQSAAVAFLQKLRPSDLGEVISFDNRVQVLQKFTGNAPALEKAIRSTAAHGSTALYNAIYIALRELKSLPARREDEMPRQAIVLFTDGEDTSSLVTFDEVLDLAHRSDTAIYPIGLVSNDPNPPRSVREATYALRQLANETGGRSFFPNDIRALGAAYGQIYNELSSRYTIGYTPKTVRHDGAWHRLLVRVARPNVAARAKQGYFAPASK
jgi:Ca-activated chloride channel homolog